MFDKGIKFGITLLLMFPAVALLFGGAKLAAAIIMSSSDSTLVQLAGAVAGVAPLWALPTLITKFNSVTGRFGLPGAGFKLNRLKKGAEGIRDRRQNIARARRLEGKSMFSGVGERIRGDGSSRFRRGAAGVISGATAVGSFGARAQLKSDLKNANAEKAVSEAKQAYVADKIAEQIEKTGSSRYAQSIAGPTGNVSKIQAAAIATQQAATLEAVKNAQTMMRAEIPPGELHKVGDVLAEAIRENDSIKAQAAQNILMTSGSKGLTQYRDTMTNLGNTDPGLMSNAASVAMRKNMLENHSGVKASAADFIAQAATGSTMGDASNSAASWKMSDNELVKQKPASIELALKSGAISQERAGEIMSNSELYDNLERDIQTMLTDWATSPPGTKPEDLAHFNRP